MNLLQRIFCKKPDPEPAIEGVTVALYRDYDGEWRLRIKTPTATVKTVPFISRGLGYSTGTKLARSIKATFEEQQDA